MKIISIAFIVALSTIAFAKDFTRGKGKFSAQDEDSYEFIKKQLLHEGFKDIISKELSKVGLNQDLFWQKYNEKLAEKFRKVEQELKLKYKIDDKSSAATLRRFDSDFRKRKLIIERSFGDINSIIPRWVVKKTSRSQKYPRNRYIQLEGEVDNTRLNRVYFSFVKGKSEQGKGTLYVRINFDLKGLSYSDIGIENEKDFDRVIADKWLEWFTVNKPLNVSQVVLVDEKISKKLKNLNQIPSDQILNNIPAEFENSMLLDINFIIQQIDSNKELNIFEFSYMGNAYLKNLQSNIVLATYSIKKEEKEYRLAKAANLANILANHVYQIAKGYFGQVIGDIKNITPVSSVQKVSLQGFGHIGRMNSFLEEVLSRGVRYSLKAEVESMSQNQAEIIFFYDGKLDQIKGLFTEIQAAKKDPGFELIDTSDVLSIKFNNDKVEI